MILNIRASSREFHSLIVFINFKMLYKLHIIRIVSFKVVPVLCMQVNQLTSNDTLQLFSFIAY